MAKILMMTIQVHFCVLLQVSLGLGTNSPELLLLKFLPLNYYHSYFLAATLILHLFSPWDFEAGSFFHSLLFLYKYHFFFNCTFIIHQSWPMTSFGAFYLSFPLLQEWSATMKKMLHSKFDCGFFLYITLIFIVDLGWNLCTWWLLIKCLQNDFQCNWTMCTE